MIDKYIKRRKNYVYFTKVNKKGRKNKRDVTMNSTVVHMLNTRN